MVLFLQLLGSKKLKISLKGKRFLAFRIFSISSNCTSNFIQLLQVYLQLTLINQFSEHLIKNKITKSIVKYIIR